MSSSIDVLRGQLLHLAQPGADHVCALLPALCPDLFVPGSKVEALRLKSNVVRVQSDSGGRLVSVVLKCLPRTVAERTALLITRWLPRIDLANAAPALLGTIPGDAYHWHVYEDLGTSELDATRPRLDVVAAAVDLIARLHTRAAGSALLAECQQHLDDLGMPYFASNVSEAIVKLEALSAAEHGFTGAERRVCTCLITRLNQLLDSLSRRTEFMRRCGGPYTLLHGDLWTINTVVVAGPEGPRARLIDWDRIGVGPVSYDLSTFLYRFPAVREGDADAIDHLVREAGREAIHVADRSRDFFTRLAGETNPERKRTIIGETFLVVQEEEFARLGLRDDEWLLGQGTIYPDTIESGGASHSAKIKTHHNRVERIQALIEQGKVIEPLVELYKDEVRVLGEQLGLPHEVVWRHPFPGPGLAVRCLGGEHTGAVEPFTLALPPGVRAALVPVRTVGVQGDERSYSNLLALDGALEAEAAGALARRITNEHRTINRVALVVYRRGGRGVDGLAIHPATLTPARIALLREADDLVTRIVRKHGLYDAIWQFPVGLIPLGATPGRETIVLRPVNSRDGMTADFARLPATVVDDLATSLAALPAVDAVLYDVTNKPPATIELE